MAVRKLDLSNSNVATATSLTFDNVAPAFSKASLNHIINLTGNNLEDISQLAPFQLNHTCLL